MLWEDSAGVKPREFGPGCLVNGCVADSLGWEWNDVRLRTLIAHVPRNGNTHVVAQCVQFADAGIDAVIYAVLDLDRAHELVGLPANACVVKVRDALAARTRTGKVRLIDRNVESLVAITLELVGERKPAKRKPVPDERDRILNKLARDAEAGEKRRRLRASSRSFDRLVLAVEADMRALLGP